MQIWNPDNGVLIDVLFYRHPESEIATIIIKHHRRSLFQCCPLLFILTKRPSTASSIINILPIMSSLTRLSKSLFSKGRISQMVFCTSRTAAASSSYLLPVVSPRPFTITNVQPFSSDSITYSGGQASSGSGQGGYYGSGGARAKAEAKSTHDITQEQRSKMLAISTDVETIQLIMEEIQKMEDLLREDQIENDNEVTDRSVEIRGKMKSLVSQQLLESLERLEIEGGPKWGLTSEEHDLVMLAREKVNTC